MMDKSFYLHTLAIGGIVILEGLNIVFLKTDGLVLSTCVGALAGLGGYVIGKKKLSQLAQVIKAVEPIAEKIATDVGHPEVVKLMQDITNPLLQANQKKEGNTPPSSG